MESVLHRKNDMGDLRMNMVCGISGNQDAGPAGKEALKQIGDGLIQGADRLLRWGSSVSVLTKSR